MTAHHPPGDHVRSAPVDPARRAPSGGVAALAAMQAEAAGFAARRMSAVLAAQQAMLRNPTPAGIGAAQAAYLGAMARDYGELLGRLSARAAAPAPARPAPRGTPV